MRILVACEESQAVTIEFRALGHEAYSCDILESSGGKPEWHIQGDVLQHLQSNWDVIIGFPPCTYLTVTGNSWFNVEKYGQAAIDRYEKRKDAVAFFMAIANAPAKHIAIENPVGIISTEWVPPTQIIQPYYFGDPFEKKTCLWLKRLPKLMPTNLIKPEPRKVFKSGCTMPPWYVEASKLPPAERSKARSKTFPGIAKAMATQWSAYLAMLYEGGTEYFGQTEIPY